MATAQTITKPRRPKAANRNARAKAHGKAKGRTKVNGAARVSGKDYADKRLPIPFVGQHGAPWFEFAAAVHTAALPAWMKHGGQAIEARDGDFMTDLVEALKPVIGHRTVSEVSIAYELLGVIGNKTNLGDTDTALGGCNFWSRLALENFIYFAPATGAADVMARVKVFFGDLMDVGSRDKTYYADFSRRLQADVEFLSTGQSFLTMGADEGRMPLVKRVFSGWSYFDPYRHHLSDRNPRYEGDDT